MWLLNTIYFYVKISRNISLVSSRISLSCLYVCRRMARGCLRLMFFRVPHHRDERNGFSFTIPSQTGKWKKHSFLHNENLLKFSQKLPWIALRNTLVLFSIEKRTKWNKTNDKRVETIKSSFGCDKKNFYSIFFSYNKFENKRQSASIKYLNFLWLLISSKNIERSSVWFGSLPTQLFIKWISYFKFFFFFCWWITDFYVGRIEFSFSMKVFEYFLLSLCCHGMENFWCMKMFSLNWKRSKAS